MPEVVEAVGDRMEALVDGGVRRGTDVLKALALGARAVLIGRPYLYGLALGGEDGRPPRAGSPAPGTAHEHDAGRQAQHWEH